MYFERTWQGDFKPPAEYSRDAAVVDHHPRPADARRLLAGRTTWRRARRSISFPSQQLRARQYEERARDRGRLLAALEREGLLPAGMSADHADAQGMNDALARAVHAFVARAPSKILMIQLEDLLGQIEQVNVPGTTDERYPNWRRKLPASSRNGRTTSASARCSSSAQERGTELVSCWLGRRSSATSPVTGQPRLQIQSINPSSNRCVSSSWRGYKRRR